MQSPSLSMILSLFIFSPMRVGQTTPPEFQQVHYGEEMEKSSKGRSRNQTLNEFEPQAPSGVRLRNSFCSFFCVRQRLSVVSCVYLSIYSGEFFSVHKSAGSVWSSSVSVSIQMQWCNLLGRSCWNRYRKSGFTINAVVQ